MRVRGATIVADSVWEMCECQRVLAGQVGSEVELDLRPREPRATSRNAARTKIQRREATAGFGVIKRPEGAAVLGGGGRPERAVIVVQADVAAVLRGVEKDLPSTG